MDAVKGVKGQGRPLYADPRSNDSVHEPCRRQGRMSGQAFLVTFSATGKSDSPVRGETKTRADSSRRAVLRTLTRIRATATTAWWVTWRSSTEQNNQSRISAPKPPYETGLIQGRRRTPLKPYPKPSALASCVALPPTSMQSSPASGQRDFKPLLLLHPHQRCNLHLRMHLLDATAPAHTTYRAGIQIIQAHGQLQMPLRFGQAVGHVKAVPGVVQPGLGPGVAGQVVFAVGKH